MTKPSQNEDEYFAKLDAELLKKQRTGMSKAAIAAERKTHIGKCPRCGADLVDTTLHDIHIERCPECDGIWLDPGELEDIAKHHDPGTVGLAFQNLFAALKKKKKARK